MELLAGDTAAAEREIRRGLAILEPSGAHGYQETLLAQVLFEQGRLDEAAQHIDAGAQNAAPDNVAAQVLWRGVRAKLDVADAPDAAVSLAREAVALAEATESPNLLGDALSDLAVVLRIGRQRRRERRCPACARALRAQGQSPGGPPDRRRALRRALGVRGTAAISSAD